MASCDVVVSDILAYVAGCWQEFLAGKTLRLNSYHCTEGIPKALLLYPCGQPSVGWFSGGVGLVYRRDVTRCLCCFKTPRGNAGRDIPTPESWSKWWGSPFFNAEGDKSRELIDPSS